jgi:hypothetical protein
VVGARAGGSVSVVGKRLVMVALIHGIDPASIWTMTFLEFAAAVERAKRRMGN